MLRHESDSGITRSTGGTTINNKVVQSDQLTRFSDKILDHNGVHPLDYPESGWFLVPFPASKGIPFNSDNLATVNDYSFTEDHNFQALQSVAKSRWKEGTRDISWRLHVFLWAIETATTRSPESDIVELGTGQGFMAAASCQRIAQLGAFSGRFFLFDTFEREDQSLFYYSDDVEEVRSYFERFDFVRVIEGRLPASLRLADPKRISFLHVDLNSASAEDASLDEISPLLEEGALVLFDDAGNPGCQDQLDVAKNFAGSRKRPLLQLPTGQALLFT